MDQGTIADKLRKSLDDLYPKKRREVDTTITGIIYGFTQGIISKFSKHNIKQNDLYLDEIFYLRYYIRDFQESCHDLVYKLIDITETSLYFLDERCEDEFNRDMHCLLSGRYNLKIRSLINQDFQLDNFKQIDQFIQNYKDHLNLILESIEKIKLQYNENFNFKEITSITKLLRELNSEIKSLKQELRLTSPKRRRIDK